MTFVRLAQREKSDLSDFSPIPSHPSPEIPGNLGIQVPEFRGTLKGRQVMNNRARGVLVYPIRDTQVTGPFDHYALVTSVTGEVRMIHSEGVSYVVSDDKPWTWNDYDESCPKFTPDDLKALVANVEPVDLADWVRTFGARLESNFAQNYYWATNPNPER